REPDVIKSTGEEWQFGIADSPAIRLAAYAHSEYADRVVVLTFWQIVDPEQLGPRHPAEYDRRLKIFVHLLDAEGNIVSQHDTLQAPAWNWTAGDTFVQIHRLPRGESLPPGDYVLRVGIYTLPGIANLHTPDGAEFVLLPTVRLP
ncbi:MAG: hypothetical protein ACE5FI_12950, partial [Anaerolineales bacterium]